MIENEVEFWDELNKWSAMGEIITGLLADKPAIVVKIKHHYKIRTHTVKLKN